MANTKYEHQTPPETEGDGINYRGIFWFVAIMAITTVISQALMWGLFRFLEGREIREDAARAPLAAPLGQLPPPPNLLMNEPLNLETFRAREDAILTSYAWADKNAGTVRIPIDRAKELILERGIPGGSPLPAGAPAAAPGKDASPAPSAPAGKIIK
jgi:hypothetical protein